MDDIQIDNEGLTFAVDGEVDVACINGTVIDGWTGEVLKKGKRCVRRRSNGLQY